jgi:hypothetical protein
MARRPLLWLFLSFLAGLLAAGWPVWTSNYKQDDLTGPGYLSALAILSLIGMLLIVANVATAPRVLALLGLCMPFAVLLRVVIDTATDATSHNFWPMELLLMSAVTAAALLPGLLIGVLIRRVAA